MEITIGKLKVELGSAALYAGTSPAQGALARMVRRKSRRETAYRWNCGTQTGIPAEWPRRITITTEYILAPHLVFVPFGGGGPIPSDDAWHAAADLSKSNFARELKRSLPDFTVTVDWADYVEPYKDLYSFDIVVQTQFMLVFGRPKGLTMRDHMFILTPVDVTVMPVVTGRCEGTEPNGTVLGGFTFHRSAFPEEEHATFRALEPIILEESESAREMRERLKEQLGDHTYWGPYFR